jgi:hypothetical protein
MIIFALILLTAVAAAGLLALNQGPMDKELKRRNTHWSRFERK